MLGVVEFLALMTTDRRNSVVMLPDFDGLVMFKPCAPSPTAVEIHNLIV